MVTNFEKNAKWLKKKPGLTWAHMGQLNTTLEFYGSCDITACFMLWGQGGPGVGLHNFRSPWREKLALSGSVQKALSHGRQRDAALQLVSSSLRV